MLPISDRVLQLGLIAEYWSREITGGRTISEIHDELLSAFWRNELAVFGSKGQNPICRRRLLTLAGWKSGHPGFSMVESVKLLPQTMETHPDGSITLDLTKYIVLPSNQSDWTDKVLENAYRVLAEMSFEDFDELLRPGLRALCTTREALAAYCDLRGYDLPRFWFRNIGKPVSFSGRPSVMRAISAEMVRRAERGILSPTLRKEGEALHDWAKANIDQKAQLPQPRSIENAVRTEYNGLRIHVGEQKT